MRRAEVAFWVAGIGYIALAIVSKEVYGLGRVQPAPLLYALLFLLSIQAGKTVAGRMDPRVKGTVYAVVGVTILAITSTVTGIVGVALLLTTVLAIRRLFMPVRTNAEWFRDIAWKVAFLGAVTTAVAGFLLGGIPLLEPALRYSQYRVLYLSAGYLLALSIAMRPSVFVLALGILLGIATTFRTVLLAPLLAYFFRTMLGSWKPEGVKRVAPLIALGIVAGFLARYWATVSSYPSWHLDFLGTLLYRPGVTYTVYERLFWLGYPLGRHEILFSTNPKLLVGHLFGRDVGYTYTMFGQPAYDFGLTGLLEGVLLGMAVGDSFRFRTTATLSLTLMTLAIPIGLDAFFVSAVLLNGLITSEVMACESRS